MSIYPVDVRLVHMFSADPSYTGFQAIDDAAVAHTRSLVVANRIFFAESFSISKQFVNDYIGSRRRLYHEKGETKKSIRRGMWFFLACCFLDIVVTSI